MGTFYMHSSDVASRLDSALVATATNVCFSVCENAFSLLDLSIMPWLHAAYWT